ncbi:MAG: hypothetical protein KBH07_04645 [Flavobacteriales bacterium]|nr:hypothetical protein [Flavobacteriales bacterium]
MKHPLLSVLLLGLLAAAQFGCRKDQLFTDAAGAELQFSRDSILFDTVFTTVGTVTRRFTARNTNSEGVRVDIQLEGGSPSPFRINVDGSSGLSFSQVEIPAGDSIFVFVEATLGPGGVNTPFVIEDHIRFTTNGHEQRVALNAWGQDAHFFRPDNVVQGLPPFSYIAGGYDSGGNQICEDVQWVNDKPYVIFGYAVVDSCCSLAIDPGVRVYFHGGGGLWVYQGGNIVANGTAQEKITFQGDRREAMYADLPGQWDRIWVNEGPADQVFNHVDIKNALIGLQPQSWIGTPGQPTSTNQLVLDNVSIRNCSAAGILSENYRIKSTNLLVANCGQYCVALTGGGQYVFNHSTVANYWGYDVRQEPAFILTNTFSDITGAVQVRQVENSSFRNGIIEGNNANEFELSFNDQLPPDFQFSNFLLRTTIATTDAAHFEQSTVYRNQSPGFKDGGGGNYHLNENAFVRHKGSDPFGQDSQATFDLDGVLRPSDISDLGCYTFVP